jgi:hypothetical protein
MEPQILPFEALSFISQNLLQRYRKDLCRFRLLHDYIAESEAETKSRPPQFSRRLQNSLRDLDEKGTELKAFE